jgi:hypothetical protein
MLSKMLYATTQNLRKKVNSVGMEPPLNRRRDVTITAMTSAASVASLLTTTQAMIAEKPSPKEDSHAGAGADIGVMGGKM